MKRKALCTDGGRPPGLCGLWRGARWGAPISYSVGNHILIYVEGRVRDQQQVTCGDMDLARWGGETFTSLLQASSCVSLMCVSGFMQLLTWWHQVSAATLGILPLRRATHDLCYSVRPCGL